MRKVTGCDAVRPGAHGGLSPGARQDRLQRYRLQAQLPLAASAERAGDLVKPQEAVAVMRLAAQAARQHGQDLAPPGPQEIVLVPVISVVVWALVSGTSGHLVYPWPLCVAGPFGAACSPCPRPSRRPGAAAGPLAS